jgi:hypothetical protein
MLVDMLNFSTPGQVTVTTEYELDNHDYTPGLVAKLAIGSSEDGQNDERL